ncbi:hypothetical protein J1605_011089 [Eschrichtius robustus]|uniref:Uncharacterized protein n=1 Tax=Eschrichtius robustus TaxID=9764 RepID=A0AB34GR44_ESCRO|nr:hypothetical protein J1605_011089 [Eschrichtius robustus]
MCGRLRSTRALGDSPSHPDGPGRDAGAETPAAGLCYPFHPGLQARRIPAPRTPPGHWGRERRGRTASRGGEPEVQGGAPGNPSPSEVRARMGRGGRRVEGGERSGARRQGGGTARRPRPRLSEPALRRLRTRSLYLLPLDGGGARAGAAAGGSARDPETSSAGASSRHARPPGGESAAALKGHPGLGGGIPQTRGAAALAASFSARGAQRWRQRGLPGHLQVRPCGGSVASSHAGLPKSLEPRASRASEGQQRSTEGEPAV